MLRLSRLALLPLLAASPALAHGAESGPIGWTLAPQVAIPLFLTALLYGIGAWRLRRRSRLGRGERAKGATLFASGWLVLALALTSPLHEGGEQSFTLHMIEHELVMLAAAWLLAASRPLPVFLWALPHEMRGRVGALGTASWLSAPWRFLTDPVVATIVQALMLVAWHMPALFDRALGSEAWHVGQHLCFLGSALLFWWAMANGRGTGYGLAALCLFATSLVGGMLGALMSVSASPWYRGYAAMAMTPLGLDPAEDQHLAGLLMWIPGGLVHAGAALFFLYKWLKASEVSHAVAAE
ncbi:MAG: putative rane protein [Sphingomonadales bacterium]|jgi:cytochrome c oxidase assembly factor CtaG|nr:putative rane protein [Sphingomonadales bacterium]